MVMHEESLFKYRKSIISLVPLFCVSLLLSAPLFFDVPFRNSLKIVISLFLLLSACAAFWRSPKLKVLIFLVVFFIAANSAITLFSRLVYQGGVNSGFAMSVILSNKNEAHEIITQNTKYVVFFAMLFMLALSVVVFSSNNVPKKTGITAFFLFLLYIVVSTISYYKSSKYTYFNDHVYPKIVLTVEKTPFYNLSSFIEAWYDIKAFEKIDKYQPEYAIEFLPSYGRHKTIVLVIGESARRDNFQIYGYKYNTSPNLVKERDNIKLFESAISPAPLTVLSVPMMLSAQTPENTEVKLIADNILNIANQSGYDTYWISTQDKLGRHNSAITAIAKSAKHQVWLDGLDMTLLPELSGALRGSSKNKLIIVHTNGSHPDFCKRFDDNFNFFKNGSGKENCYNNSILYTDALLGDFIGELKKNDDTSVMIYGSDHGLQKTDDIGNFYVHGSGNKSAEPYKVPMLLWFANVKMLQGSKRVKELYSLSNVYDLIISLIGVNVKEHITKNISDANEKKYVIDANKKYILYS